MSPQQGFTLLEMLIALVVVAVAIATATLALRPDEARQLAAEAERLALLMAQAREESALGGVPLAWVAAEDRYEFQRREVTDRGPAWVVVRGDDLLHPRELPTGLSIRRLEADGRRLAYGERLDLGLQGARRLSVDLTLGEARSRVVADEAGFRVEVVPAGRS
ncbi:MAG: prepilin-type N-terminal cleavage/methylation domain-containing protein [Gallionellaceae bacterium]|nr:prepilin-type N-terminal cleavage/methylation domain-containing protein [Gallionellaceae bacterium]